MISFQPNCTLPVGPLGGFVSGPNARSTMSIIWSCLSVLLLSTWSVLHLNVPATLRTPPRSDWPWQWIPRLRDSIQKQAVLLSTKLAWMGIMLAAPEIVVGRAAANHLVARKNHSRLARLAKDDDVQWSLAHTILANMGGIAIHFDDPDENATATAHDPQNPQSKTGSPEDDLELLPLPRSTQASSQSQSDLGAQEQLHITLTGAASLSDARSASQSSTITKTEDTIKPPSKHCPVLAATQLNADLERQDNRKLLPSYAPHQKLAAAALRSDPKRYQGSSRMQGKIWILDSKQLTLAKELRLIASLPRIEPEEIGDRSKNTGVMTFLAILQMLWLAVQLVERRRANLPSTTLEIATVAFSVGSIFVYIIELDKPMDMRVPFKVIASIPTNEATFLSIAEAAPKPLLTWQSKLEKSNVTDGSAHQTTQKRTAKKQAAEFKPFGYFFLTLDCIMSISSAIFGGIHLIAWNYEFPTSVEQKTWRAAACIVAIAPILWVLVVRWELSMKHGNFIRNVLPRIRWGGLASLYLLSRLFIVVEVLRSLYYLHPKAFVATWTANAPHIG